MATYLYCGSFYDPGGMTRVNLNTFLKSSHLSFSGAGEGWTEWIAKDSLFAYSVCYYTDPGKIIKINLATFAQVATLNLLAGERDLFGAAISGGFLYVSSAAEKIIKIDLSNFTRVSALNLANADPSSLHISGSYLYAVHSSNPAAVTKIDLSNFSIVSETTYAGQSNIICGIIYGDYLYGGCVQNPARILKIALSDLTLTSTLTLASGKNRAMSLAISGTNLYVGLHTEIAETNPPPYVTKVDLATFTETATLTDATHRTMWAAEVVGDYLYLGDYTDPAEIIKVNLTTFIKDSVLILTAADNEYLISRNFITSPIIYPSSSTTRVSGIVHYYNPRTATKEGKYAMEAFLGGLSTGFAIPRASGGPEPAILPYMVTVPIPGLPVTTSIPTLSYMQQFFQGQYGTITGPFWDATKRQYYYMSSSGAKLYVG